MKNLALTIIFCLTTNLLLSQNNNSNKKRENREAIKIAFFTKKMDLNADALIKSPEYSENSKSFITVTETDFDRFIPLVSHLRNSVQNPKYIISFKGTSKSILGYSKRYDNEENKNPFIAITTCNNADTNCPFIPEALLRFHLPFVDPKSSDETDLQDETYLKTNQQIAAEIYYIFSEIKKG